MTVHDDLFALVKSLTPSEKRQFTLHARRHAADPKYYRLFEVLDAMDAYADEAVRQALGDPVQGRVLAAMRHTLMDEIITALSKWSPRGTPDDLVKREQDAVQFLYERGCRPACERHLRKAIALAVDNELPSRVLELCVWERRLHGNDIKAMRACDALEQRAARMICELYGPATADALPPSISRVAQIRDARRRGTENRQVLSLIDEARDLIPAHGLLFAEIIIDVIIDASLARDVAVIRSARTLVRDAFTSDLPPAVLRMATVADTFSCMALALHNGRPESALDLHIDGSLLPPGVFAVWSVHRAAVALAADEEQLALQIINEVLRDTHLRTDRPLWYGQALVLNVLIHYAIGNEDFVPYCIRSAQRKNDGKSYLQPADLAVLRAVQRMVDGSPDTSFTSTTALVSTATLIAVIRAWALSLDRRLELELHRPRVGAA